MTEVNPAPVASPSRRMSGLLPWAVLLGGSVLFRLPALINARGVHSDAAIVGLQAMHILQGEWSWFLWGAGYQASFDAVLIALGFALTGPSALTLMMVPLLGHLACVGLAYDALRRWVAPGAAAIACLPLVVAPQAINGVALYAPRQWSITAVFLAVWLVSRSLGASKPVPWLIGGGFFAGFALYLDLFALQLMVGFGVFALASAAAPLRPVRGLLTRVAGLAAGTLLGALLVAWSRSQPMADAAKTTLSLERLGPNARLLWETCLPWLLGTKVFIPGERLYPDLWIPPWPVGLLQWVALGSVLLAVAVAGVAVLRGKVAPAVRRAALLGVGITASSVGGFLVSSMPSDMWSARYLAPVVWFLPFTLAPLAGWLGARRFGMALAPYLVVAAIGGWLALGPYVQGPLPVRTARGVAEDEAEVARVLREKGVTHAAAQYWLSYRLGFLFQESPVVIPLAAWEDRYPPYRAGFQQAPVVAYLFHPSEPRATPGPYEAQLRATGARYERLEIRGFTVLIHHRR